MTILALGSPMEIAAAHARIGSSAENSSPAPRDQTSGGSGDEYPWTVREAAKFLGVSPQTVYLWVERRSIPHLRVMGRNIRFLKSDLERFRASFKQEIDL